MSKFVDIICKNLLTGEMSQFGNISNDAVKKKLVSILSDNVVADGDFVSFSIEEFCFCAYKNVRYLDNDGKQRIITYSEKEIVDFCTYLYEFLKSQTRDFIDYTHDIQYLVGALNAKSWVKKSQENDIDAYRSNLEKVNLVSILISAKSTYFRYLTEDLEILEIDDVSVTGKTFKLYKGIPFLAESRRKNVTATFNSNSKSHIKMIDIFEFIPYTIIENAIKYGPKDIDLDIDIFEDREDIRVSISSMGPLLDDGEESKIFERGYRGRIVRQAGFPGHGLGLFQANKAAGELFRGKISVRQNKTNMFNLNGIEYSETAFVIVIPK